LLALTIVAFDQATAQKTNYITNSGMLIGFGIGASYQQSDITNSRGAGFDFTLGHPIYKKENAFFSVDWKFRFLAGENKAYDHRIQPDTTYKNIRLDIINCDLEFGLTFNRLRELTRIVITGFAGAGMTYGSTSTDLYDANGLLYDYSVINPNQGRSKIHSDLVKLSDGNFETPLVNRASILPTLGLFIGYQFSPSFMLGFEHKTNFSLTEKNSWDGINIDNNIMTGSKLDRIHYTTLSFRWNLRGRSARPTGGYTYSGIPDATPVNKPINTTEPIPTPPPVRTVPPVVDITVPSGSTYSTTEESIDISAQVQNVRSRQDIQVVLNGKNIGFEYDPGAGIIKSILVLTNGRNDLVITGTNQEGSARDNVAINFNKPVRTTLPVIRFINPPNPLTVDQNIFGISVQTVNVKAWQDVTVTVNGINTTNFNFSADGVVNTNVALKEGANRVEVSGKNESGTAKEHTTITYVKAVKIKPPIVSILIPGNDPYVTYQSSQEIKATVTDVKSKENITLSINGINSNDFTYDNTSLSLNTTVTLKEGRNVISISARNESGEAAKTQYVIKETRPVTETKPDTETRSCPQPELRMIAPTQDDLITDSPSYTFRTDVKNIARRDQLLLTLNSKNITSFGFNGVELICTASLNAGSNSFILTAKNDCGTITVTSSIIFKPAEPVIVKEKPCPAPGLNFSVNAINQNDATHELKGSVSNVKNRSEITMAIDNTPFGEFQFVPNAGVLGARFKFNPGTHIIKVSVKNECGQTSVSDTVIIKQPKPCPPPALRMTAPSQNDLIIDNPSYIFRTEVKNITGKDQLLLTFNSVSVTSFSFAGNELTYTASLISGTNSFFLTARNSCGTATVTSSIIYRPGELAKDTVKTKEQNTCGVRINPGNSSWEFCLVTPSDTFSRENLTNSKFSYSGPAKSLFFKPIAGGGDAEVNGKPYILKSGEYYLFTGNLSVMVSTKNPGSMGQWSVCIKSNKDPVYGNGNNRPKSPCEGLQEDGTSKKTGPSQDAKPSKDVKPSQEIKKDTTKTSGKK